MIALAAVVALAGCRATPSRPAAVSKGIPPEERPPFVEAFRKALSEGTADSIAPFVAFRDPMDAEFFRLVLPPEPPPVPSCSPLVSSLPHPVAARQTASTAHRLKLSRVRVHMRTLSAPRPQPVNRPVPQT